MHVFVRYLYSLSNLFPKLSIRSTRNISIESSGPDADQELTLVVAPKAEQKKENHQE